MKKYLRWNYIELLTALFGLFIYCFAVNTFIVPNHLYNGGVMGLSQLIRTFILSFSNIKASFDIATPIYYFINIPLLYLAYKKMGKYFFYRTLFSVTICTVFLFIIPSDKLIITDSVLTNVLIGGAMIGFGCGIALSVGASTGGVDIIGMILTSHSKKITVGNFCLAFNAVIYIICGIMNGLEIMIYSILSSIFDSVILDRMHIRNICSTMMVFSKKHPKRIIDYIKQELDRDATYWEATGGYDDSKSYITYIVLSKYEKYLLETKLKQEKFEAFIVESNGVSVLGEFKKKL